MQTTALVLAAAVWTQTAAVQTTALVLAAAVWTQTAAVQTTALVLAAAVWTQTAAVQTTALVLAAAVWTQTAAVPVPVPTGRLVRPRRPISPVRTSRRKLRQGRALHRSANKSASCPFPTFAYPRQDALGKYGADLATRTRAEGTEASPDEAVLVVMTSRCGNAVV